MSKEKRKDKSPITLDREKKVFPIVLFCVGVLLMILNLAIRLNICSVVSVAYCCVISAVILICLIAKRRIYAFMVYGFSASLLGVVLYYTIFGADAGFGAFTTALAGFSTADHPLLCGEGNLFTRLIGNILLALGCFLSTWGLYFCSKGKFKKGVTKTILSFCLSLVLVLTSVLYVLTMNMRSKPNTERLYDGEKDYLDNIDSTPDKNRPNVLFILMDDLGYGDVSLNGSLIDTPNIDSIGENGINFENFYSSYSVCSPARFAALTGRYPYRGYADNVIYPTVDSIKPFAQTRIFNSVQLGGNVDGMLGDEITMAEMFKSAGYDTGLFGKWHLGDYGEYLPTNQGFDYFYGGYYVNDMAPFYHCKEENGEYEIVHGTDELKDQSNATKWIHDEISDWIKEESKTDKPFFAFYTTPWPHAPVFVGDEFKGATGMGTYADCVTEFDHYLGVLFDEMDKEGVLDNTIIIFTSDNGPALEGSTKELRGGKYLAYEGGQKVPFMIRWDKANGKLGEVGNGTAADGRLAVRKQSATLVDLFPTLAELCSIQSKSGEKNYLPKDRIIDGVSMVPLLENDDVIHTKEHPIIHMKREDIKAIQYTVPTADVKSQYPAYNYDVLNDNEFITFKYFDRIQNDNSAFFDKYRKNWLHVLTDDTGENYNRQTVYPEIADEFHERLDELQSDFEHNRRGISNS